MQVHEDGSVWVYLKIMYNNETEKNPITTAYKWDHIRKCKGTRTRPLFSHTAALNEKMVVRVR